MKFKDLSNNDLFVFKNGLNRKTDTIFMYQKVVISDIGDGILSISKGMVIKAGDREQKAEVIKISS